MRDKLCKQETNWQEAFKARDWLVDQLNTLKQTAEDPLSTQAEVVEQINNMLCVLSSDKKGVNDAD